MKRRKIKVAVSGLNAIDSPGPGISVIRALRDSLEFDVKIIGLSYESLEPGIYMHDLVDKTYQIPLPSAGAAILMERLNYIHEKEKIDIIIPNFDAELPSFIKLKKQLDKKKIRTYLPTMDQFESRQKVNLAVFGKKHKIKVPMTKVISTSREIAGLQNDFSYPLVVKGKFYDASVAYSPDQVANYFNKISSKWGLPVIIQEFVSGSEINMTALGDGTGLTIGAVPMRKQYITDKGKAWAGISIDDTKLMAMTHKIIQSTKWVGGLELEVVKTSEDVYYLLEINPRFPAWIYLAVGCGQNHPEALVKLAMGDKVRAFKEYEVGKMFIRYSFDMIVGLDEFEKISTVGEL